MMSLSKESIGIATHPFTHMAAQFTNTQYQALGLVTCSYLYLAPRIMHFSAVHLFVITFNCPIFHNNSIYIDSAPAAQAG